MLLRPRPYRCPSFSGHWLTEATAQPRAPLKKKTFGTRIEARSPRIPGIHRADPLDFLAYLA